MIKVDFYELDKMVGSIYWDGEGFKIEGDLPKGILNKPVYISTDEGIVDLYSHENAEGWMENLYKHYKSAYFRAAEPERTIGVSDKFTTAVEKAVKRIKGYTAHRKGKLVAVPTYQAERKEGWKDYEYMKQGTENPPDEFEKRPTLVEGAAEGFDPSKAMPPEYWAAIPEDLQKRIREDLDADAKVFEGYTIGQHTKMVLKQHDTYFKDGVIPLLGRLNFRLFLMFHDLGKAEAARNGETKENQYKYNAQMIEKIFNYWKYAPNMPLAQFDIVGAEKTVAVMKALASQDILGNYFTKKMTVEASASRFIETAQELNVDPIKFLELAKTYFMCDAGAYTEDAGGIRSLDHLFKFEPLADKSFMEFSPAYKAKFRKLEMKVKTMQIQAGDYVEVYHGSSGKHLTDIVNQGLRVKRYHNFGEGLYGGKRGYSVFVTANSSDAAYFCNQAVRHLRDAFTKDDSENIPVVIKLKIPVKYFEKKAEVDQVWNAASAFMLPEVKPEWIERVATFPKEKTYEWENDFSEAKGTLKERSETVFNKMETLWERLAKAVQDYKIMYLPTNLKSWNELKEKIDEVSSQG